MRRQQRATARPRVKPSIPALDRVRGRSLPSLLVRGAILDEVVIA